eukprot:TRINITY_DN11747_c0_g1_i1.p1 TRINITY_DN11747_c0_g1~~TRINITY_DN11747_c0_g1_i1.p1  ORF type:complete len:615 (-),score=149.82 TRINITY_DN11747_c0_g1_i1:27-1871(-)
MSKQTTASLRIFFINDVYELEKMANLATCMKQYHTVNSICVLAGDFVAPSVQAALDRGRAMIDVMNLVGVTHVCLGNHEANIKWKELQERSKESTAVWINSNMPLDVEGLDWPEYAIVDIKGTDGQIVKKVALLGVNTNSPQYYCNLPEPAFGGAQILDINETLSKFHDELEEDFDAIIPLTHQKMAKDRKTAKLGLGFPVILGGHDHNLYHEVILDQHVIKVGQNADRIGIIDVIWLEGVEKPKVKVQVHDADLYEPDPVVSEQIYNHKEMLRYLEKTILCPFPPDIEISSEFIRSKSTTMGTFIASLLKESFSAEVAIVGSGFLRAAADYSSQTYFTFADLVNELPMNVPVLAIQMPGKIIADVIKYSRTGDRVSTGAFLQTDSEVVWDSENESVTQLAGEDLDPGRSYLTVVHYHHLHGNDSLEPLLEWYEDNKDTVPGEFEAFISPQIVIVEFLAKRLLYQLSSMSDLDTDEDGKICKEDVERVLKKNYGEETTRIMTANIFAALDLDHDGYISKEDMLQDVFIFSSFQNIDENNDGVIDKEELSEYLHKIMRNMVPSEEEIQTLFDEIDSNDDNQISLEELHKWIVDHHTKAIGKYSITGENQSDFLQS